MSILYKNKLKGFISLDNPDETEELFFNVQTTMVKKPIMGIIKAGYIEEKKELPDFPEMNYRAGEVIFTEDFEKYILPQLNNYIQGKFKKIEEAENNFIEKVIYLLQNSKNFREVVDDTIRNENFRGKHL